MRIVNTITRWVEYLRARPPAWAEDVPTARRSTV